MDTASPHRTPRVRDRAARTLNGLRGAAHEQSGSTLIELLVVCLIVGVLAAIAIPSFASQKGKAVDASAKVLARAAQTAAETVAADDSGSYEKLSIAEVKRVEPEIDIVASAEHAYLSGAGGTKGEYSVTAKATGGDEFTITRNALGEVSRKCVSPVSKTGCGGAEVGGW